jgi:hypothetical protein
MSENTETVNLEVLPASALEAITRGEIDVQIATAHRYPRSIEMFKKRAIAMATIDIETAESCLYCRPVGGGKNAEGMSVRMAEIVGACYGNLRVGAIIVEQTEGYVKTRGVAHDLETNFASSSDIIESTMKADGKTPYDVRMRVVAAKAAVAKARRDATFQVVPRALARPIERAVRDLLADDKVQTFTERRDGVVKWIVEKLKIDPKRVWAMLGINGQDDLQQEHLETLAGLKTAIRENDTTVDEAFPGVTVTKPLFKKKEVPLSHTAAPGGESKAQATTAESAKPDAGTGPVSPERQLFDLMAADAITPAELARCLKANRLAVPSAFKGPEDLRDDVLADALKDWQEFKTQILAERVP